MTSKRKNPLKTRGIIFCKIKIPMPCRQEAKVENKRNKNFVNEDTLAKEPYNHTRDQVGNELTF